jgi:hypothetical protein
MKRSVARPVPLRGLGSEPMTGKSGAVDVKGQVFRFGARLVTLLPKVMGGSAGGARANMGLSGELARPAQTDRISGLRRPYAGARWL